MESLIWGGGKPFGFCAGHRQLPGLSPCPQRAGEPAAKLSGFTAKLFISLHRELRAAELQL